jgi:hypothetical protein
MRNKTAVITNPFVMAMAILVLAPIAGLWPNWVSLVLGLIIIAVAIVAKRADIL